MWCDALNAPRARDGKAPDVLRKGGWLDMREYRDTEEVEFVIVGTGAGGGTLAARLADRGSPSWRWMQAAGSAQSRNSPPTKPLRR